MKSDPSLVRRILTRGVEQIIHRESLERKLASGKRLRVKLGIDPTAPDLHLGHTVPLRKLKQFQDAGHKVVLIIGDFTARIGDPSGRTEARKPLTEREVRANEKTYLAQAGKILDIKKTEVRHNSEWLDDSRVILSLMQTASVQQLLEREDFKKRLNEQREITLIELMYPLLQGYDSVAVKADVELGAADQTLNVLMGRRVQHIHGQPEQDILTVPLMEGTDGSKKMSKSVGNIIPLRAAPNEMFGKLMSIPDHLINKYFELLTDRDAPMGVGPRDAKIILARTIVTQYHGARTAGNAEKEFVSVFSRKELPSDMPSVRVSRPSLNPIDLLMETKTAPSRSEARRLVTQGGVHLNGITVSDLNTDLRLNDGDVLRVGKRVFVRLKLK